MDIKKLYKLSEKMRAICPNSCEVHVVFDFYDLPLRLLKCINSEYINLENYSIQGIYDQLYDCVYLVANKIYTIDDAIDIWLHEVVGHHGLNSLFESEEEKNIYLDLIWTEASEILGLDPNQYKGRIEEQRKEVEELIACYAEKRSKFILKESETSIWNLIKKAIETIYKKIYKFFTNKDPENLCLRTNKIIFGLGKYLFYGNKKHLIKKNKLYFGKQYGFEDKNIVIFERDFTYRELEQIFIQFDKQQLYNEKEDSYIYLNKKQRGEILSKSAMEKSENNGFSPRHQRGILSQIKSLWKNAVFICVHPDKHGSSDITIGCYITPIRIENKEYFAWSICKHGNFNRLYCVEFLTEKNLIKKLKDLDTKYQIASKYIPLKDVFDRFRGKPKMHDSKIIISNSLHEIKRLYEKNPIEVTKYNNEFKFRKTNLLRKLFDFKNNIPIILDNLIEELEKINNKPFFIKIFKRKRIERLLKKIRIYKRLDLKINDIINNDEFINKIVKNIIKVKEKKIFIDFENFTEKQKELLKIKMEVEQKRQEQVLKQPDNPPDLKIKNNLQEIKNVFNNQCDNYNGPSM